MLETLETFTTRVRRTTARRGRVPIVLNTDQAAAGANAQWMPSLSVTAGGDVHAYWYDRAQYDE